jgi:hypothetical protein
MGKPTKGNYFLLEDGISPRYDLNDKPTICFKLTRQNNHDFILKNCHL